MAHIISWCILEHKKYTNHNFFHFWENIKYFIKISYAEVVCKNSILCNPLKTLYVYYTKYVPKCQCQKGCQILCHAKISHFGTQLVYRTFWLMGIMAHDIVYYRTFWLIEIYICKDCHYQLKSLEYICKSGFKVYRSDLINCSMISMGRHHNPDPRILVFVFLM